MSSVVSLQITIFILTGVGFVIRRIGLVNQAGQKMLASLVLNLILPCNILKAFISSSLDGSVNEYLGVLLIAIGIQLMAVVYGHVVFRHHSEGHRKCEQYATICPNADFIGNPVAEGIWGAEGLLLASIYLIPQRIMMWSTGLPVFSGSHDRKQTAKKVLLHPCIIACEIGIVFMLFHWTLPGPVMSAVSSLGNCTTAFSMLVVGMILAQMELKSFLDKQVWLFCLHRLVIIPAIIYGVCLLLPVSATVRGLCVILSAMPAGTTTSLLAQQYNMEPEFATKLVIVTTLMSLPSLFVWSLILV